jgi:hypothetical protein
MWFLIAYHCIALVCFILEFIVIVVSLNVRVTDNRIHKISGMGSRFPEFCLLLELVNKLL